MRTLLSFIAILLLATSSLPVGFADTTPIDSIDDESIEQPILQTRKMISIDLEESMALSTGSQEKNKIENTSLYVADKTSKLIHLDESLSLVTSTSDQTIHLDYVTIQLQPTVERISQTDKLRDDRKKNIKIESFYFDDNSYQQESEDLISIDTNLLKTTFFADPFNPLFEENFQNILKSVNIFEDDSYVNILTSVSNFDPSFIFDNSFVVIIFAPLVFFLFIFAEDVKFKFEKVRPFLSFVCLFIILSTVIVTPYSISSSYWPEAYADTDNMNEIISTQQTASTDDTSSSSTPAEDTGSSEATTSDNTSTSVDSTSSSSTPAEDTESTEVSSSTQQTASTDDTSSSSTPAEDTGSSEATTSDNTSTSVDSTSSSSTPAEDTESTEVSSSTQQTASTDDTSSSSTPAEDTGSSEATTSDNTSTSVDSTSSSSTPAEDTESTEVSSSTQQTASTDDTSSSSTPAEDTGSSEATTSDNTSTSVDSTSSSSTPAEDTESTEVSSSTQQTASTDDTSSSSTPAEDTGSSEATTSDNTSTSVDSTSSSSTPAEDTESTEVSSSNTTSVNGTIISGTNSTETSIPVNGTIISGTNSTETSIPVNGTIISGTNSTETSIPVNGTIISGTNSTETSIPVNGTIISGTNSTETSIPVNGTIISGTNSTETSIPVNGTIISGTNSTETSIPVNGTIISGTNSTETSIPVNGTIISGTNSTETSIPVVLPNATESWSFDTQVNGSRFIGDVYIEEADSSLILEGDGYLSNDGNSTSDLTNLSVTAWVNPDYSGGSAEFTVISKEKAFALTINNNIEPKHIATFAVFDGIKWHSVQTAEEIGDDWSHLAATFNGTTLSIYTNGTISNVNESIETIELTIEGQLEPKTIETIESTSDVVVGATLDNNRSLDDVTKQFYGEIKEVNIFDVYLSAQQITEIYSQTLPIIESLYNNTITTIEEQEEQIVVIDVLAPQPITNATNINTTNATNINTTNATNINTTNATDTSLTFNKTQTYIPIENEELNEELNKLTISTWINPSYNSGSPEFTVVSKENSFALGINNIYSPEKVPTFAIFDGITWTKISGTTQIDDWSNLIAVINGTEISLYLNGDLEATTTIPESFVILDGEVTTVDSSIAENNSDLIIGAYLDTFRDNISLSNHFSGVIDDVLVYKEALSDAEIAEIYALYVTPSENHDIPFESHLLSFTDTVTVFVNSESVSDAIHVASIDLESETPSLAQSLSFSDYVTYKINGETNESSVEIMIFSDTVVATIIPATIEVSDKSTLNESLTFFDVLSTIIPSTEITSELTLDESLTLDDSITVSLNGDNITTLDESLTLDDSITVSLNDDNIVILSESLTLLSIISHDVSDGFSNIQLEHNTIEINKPVIWTHNVTFYNNTDSVAVEIPADAEILTIKTLNDTSETVIFDSKEYSESDFVGLYDDDDISQKDLKKYFRLLDSVQTIETKILKINEKIASHENFESKKSDKQLDKLAAKLAKLEKKLDKKLDKLPDAVPLASLQQVDEMLQDDKPLKILLLNNTDDNVELTFTTPAAYTLEQDNSTNDKFEKRVTVAHESALHYTNVTAYSDIPEVLVQGGTDFRLFWNVNNTDSSISNFTRTDVTDDPRFAVEFVDTDENGIVDRMQWTVPQLSEQEFDIKADLEIINVQSYPAVGGLWKVKFTTYGTADLVITAYNGTTFGTVSPDDLLFLELNNGTHTLNPIIDGNSVTYYNYSSSGEGFEESQVLTPLKHHLMFQFGNKTAFAHNSAFVPNGPQAITLYGDPVVLGTPDTEDDMVLGSNIVIPGWDEAAERQDSIFTHDPTAGGCNGVSDECTEIQVSEAGKYRVNYGLSIDGGITASRHQAVSFVQNDTDGTGGYGNGEGASCYDSSYRRGTDNKNIMVFSSECIVDLEADGKVRVGLSKVGSSTGSGSYSFADDENWFSVQKLENPVMSLRATGFSTTVDNTGAELLFNSTNIVTQDTDAFTFTENTANWGDDTPNANTANVNWMRCMGGTSPDRSDLTLQSISISTAENGEQARVAVYQGGVLTDPQAASLVWDGGIIQDADGTVTASGANTPLAGNEVTWICIKGDDNGFDVNHINSHEGAGSDFQTGEGRWTTNALSNDETVPYPSTLAGGGTSFSNFWYSWYLTYSTTEGSVTVDQDGLYKVSYSALLNDPTFDSTRTSTIGKIQTNSTGSFVDEVYGGSITYNRDENGIDYSALSSSTILELNTNDQIRVMVTDETSRTATDLVNYHLDLEYLGTASEANILRLHDSAGGIELDSASDVVLDWDTEDEQGSHFAFTPTSDEITVNINGLYHISYGIDAEHGSVVDNERFHQKTRLQVDPGTGTFVDAKACYGESTSRGLSNSLSHSTSTAATSCMLDLEIGDIN